MNFRDSCALLLPLQKFSRLIAQENDRLLKPRFNLSYCVFSNFLPKKKKRNYIYDSLVFYRDKLNYKLS